jgi:hypothetical protein
MPTARADRISIPSNLRELETRLEHFFPFLQKSGLDLTEATGPMANAGRYGGPRIYDEVPGQDPPLPLPPPARAD